MKNKGFTLIELLAVVVILAIIMLIVVPSVSNVIEDAKKKAALENAQMYIKTINNSIIELRMLGTRIPNGSYNVMKDGNICIGPLSDINCTKSKSFILETEKQNSPTKGIISIVDENVVYADGIDFTDYFATIDVINGEQYVTTFETKINTPDLYNGSLIPVIYDKNKSNWIVVDPEIDIWYDYYNKQWANAVLLKEGVTKSIGDIVNVDGSDPNCEAKGMFVWIPRYSYALKGDLGVRYVNAGKLSTRTPGAIDIKFTSVDTIHNGSIKYNNEVDNWKTQEAFNFYTDLTTTKQIAGLWIGKFDTEYSDANATNPVSLPNKLSSDDSKVESKKVSDYMLEAQSLNAFINLGDSHMLKNSEWDSAAFLSQSIYGKYGNDKYQGENKEVYQNKGFLSIPTLYSYARKTGLSSCMPGNLIWNEDIAHPYDDFENNCGIGASTTGTIYGVYDMSGGTIQMVSGYVGKNIVNNTEGITDNIYNEVLKSGEHKNYKYYDIYYEISDAVSIVDSWYDDNAWVSNKLHVDTSLYIRRGGWIKNPRYFYNTYYSKELKKYYVEELNGDINNYNNKIAFETFIQYYSSLGYEYVDGIFKYAKPANVGGRDNDTYRLAIFEEFD